MHTHTHTPSHDSPALSGGSNLVSAETKVMVRATMLTVSWNCV